MVRTGSGIIGHNIKIPIYLCGICLIFTACLTGCVSTFKYPAARESYDRGIILRNLSKEHQASEYFRKTISMLEQSANNGTLEPEGQLLLGNSYLYVNEIENARKHYWKILLSCISDKSKSSIVGLSLVGMGETYEREGYPHAAKEFYETVLTNSGVRTEESYPEAGIRWADVSLASAEILQQNGNTKEWEKSVTKIVKKLSDLVHRFPANSGLRRMLGNAYFVMSKGSDTAYLQLALTQVLIALDTPANTVILERILMDDFSTISHNLLQSMSDPEKKQQFRQKFLEIAVKWKKGGPENSDAENN